MSFYRDRRNDSGGGGGGGAPGGFTSGLMPYANGSGVLADSGLYWAQASGAAVHQGVLAGFDFSVRPVSSSASTTSLVYSGTGSGASARQVVGQNAGAFGQYGVFGNGDAGTTAGIANANLVFLTTDPGTSTPSGLLVGTTTSCPLYLSSNNVERLKADANGNVIINRGVSMATTATNGFLLIPSCAGPPTGVPAGYSAGNNVAIQYDRINHRINIYDGSWVSVTLA